MLTKKSKNSQHKYYSKYYCHKLCVQICSSDGIMTRMIGAGTTGIRGECEENATKGNCFDVVHMKVHNSNVFKQLKKHVYNNITFVLKYSFVLISNIKTYVMGVLTIS